MKWLARISKDKWMHFTLCLLIYFGARIVSGSLPQPWPVLIALAAALGVGVGKELSDRRWCWGDIAADVLGIVTGLLVTLGLKGEL